MRRMTVLSALVMAIAFASTMTSLAASDQASARETTKVSTTQPDSTQPASSQLATLNGVKAEPMTAQELNAVKGLDVHFTTGSQNTGHPHFGPQLPGWHIVNYKHNNLGNGQALPNSGPGYSGLCGAALNSPSLSIPGQSTTTGIGGGC